MKPTVVIISIVHWHFTWQSQHNIATGLAERGYRVRFVEPLPKRWPKANEIGRVWGRLVGNSEAAGSCYQPLAPGVELVSPRLLPDTGRIAQYINRRYFVPGIARHILDIDGVAEDPLIVINYLPTSASLALMRALEPDAAFYHCVNDWTHDPYLNGDYEAELAGAADMVWADSSLNYRRTSSMNDNVIHLSKGVDSELFARARKEPSPPPQQPLCAYFGSIRGNTDIDLLRKVSHQYRLRVIGPMSESLVGFSPTTELVGAVRHDRVPDLLRDADVLLLPYLRTPFNEGLMPAKLFECLATGKPAVVSGLESLGEFDKLFYICDSHDTFLNTITESLHEPPELRSARIECAEENSYSRRISEIEGYFNQTLEQNSPDILHAMS